MSTSEAGIQLIKSFEGCHAMPYKCPAALWTVGYGRVLYPDQARLKTDQRTSYPLRSEHNRLWDADEIDALLEADLLRFSAGVRRLCPAAADNMCHHDALVSFAFNVGFGNNRVNSVQ